MRVSGSDRQQKRQSRASQLQPGKPSFFNSGSGGTGSGHSLADACHLLFTDAIRFMASFLVFQTC